MNRLNLPKKLRLSLAIFLVATAGCSGDPSISVLPSSDNFTQNGNEITAKMDILWVIDNSISMGPYQEKLKANFESFITTFVGKKYDYRMAVIATDAWALKPNKLYTTDFNHLPRLGSEVQAEAAVKLAELGVTGNICPNSTTVASSFLNGLQNSNGHKTSEDPILDGRTIISSSDQSIDFSLKPDETDPIETDDVDYLFRQNIDQGTYGCGFEAGLESIKASFDANPINAGFPREDTHLAIIVVTDEEDDIANYISDRTVLEYHDFLSSISNSEQGYSFHTIGVLAGQKGDEIPGSPVTARNKCLIDGVDTGETLHQASSEAIKYAALSDLSGGVKASICAPFSDSLQNIAKKIIETTVEFKLTDTPKTDDGAGFVVSVKNIGESGFTTIPKNSENGWTYNPERNSIIFHGSGIPAQGAEINIFYDPSGL